MMSVFQSAKSSAETDSSSELRSAIMANKLVAFIVKLKMDTPALEILASYQNVRYYPPYHVEIDMSRLHKNVTMVVLEDVRIAR